MITKPVARVTCGQEQALANELILPVPLEILRSPARVDVFKRVIRAKAMRHGASAFRVMEPGGNEILVIGFPVSADGRKGLADFHATLERETGIRISRAEPVEMLA
jgi:hypothetical protein